MRVLLAGKFVPGGRRPIGGLQSWIDTVAAELRRLGYSVILWEPGRHAPPPCDLGILANWAETGHLARLCERVVNVSHGIIEAERPGPADRVICVSEGVRDHWGVAADVLRQPIDLAFWTPGEARGAALAVRFSYRGSRTHCPQAAARLRLRYLHLRDARPVPARCVLRQAAVVWATGRAALEAMACGAPVVLYDHRSAYQRALLDGDLTRQMHNSYSGRGGITPDLTEVVAAARGAAPARAWVEAHHDVRAIVPELLR
ncbi:hypothetical protein A9320_26885 [Ruegeria sp. PBVC088]|nr:hypothetical protein A9320_26885 [Ruegeria sp. PBVC088]